MDDFMALLEATDVIKQIRKNLREEPALLLCDVCREYHKTGHIVPDYRLHLTGYMGEAALKALLDAGLIKRQPGGSLYLYCYEPTAAGLEQYERLKADGFYKE